jgi:hypothetical protein
LRVPSFKDIAALGVQASQGTKRKAEGDLKERTTAPTSFTSATLKHKFSDLMGVDFARHGELVAIERPFIDLLPDLPAAVYTRRYGQA